MNELQAGAAVVEITPGVGIAMAGYGARQGVAAGIHDPLYARVLVLDDGQAALVLAVCDLVGVPAALTRQARDLIARECGIPAANVCIAATHTHSGPLLRGSESEALIAVTARKICGAVQMARRQLRPIVLKATKTSLDTIAQNRRHPDGPIATEATVLLAAPRGPSAPVATLVNYACHATVLEHDNLLYSADFPGAAVRLIERVVGGTGIYMQGAAGDINPVWMRHDFDEVERIGGIVGTAAARAALELWPLGEGQWAVNLSWSELTPKEPPHGTVLSDARLRAVRSVLDLPYRSFPPRAEIEREIEELTRRIAALPAEALAERRALRPLLNQRRAELATLDLYAPQPGRTRPVEIQALRIAAECAVVALPGEFLIETGEEIARRCGIAYPLICGYANDYLSYFPAPRHVSEAGYEVGRALFATEATETIAAAAVELVRALYEE
jgi:neutral ceramidase